MKPKIKVISLSRSHGRREAFAKANEHLEYEFFDAVDGQLIDHSLAPYAELFEKGLAYTPGAYGSAASHHALWKEAIDSKNPLTILEDDAITRLDFEEMSLRVIGAAPPDWDFVLWGWNFDSVLSLNLMPQVSPTSMLFDQTMLRNRIPDFQSMTDTPLLLGLNKCFGIPAYSISPKGAEKLMLGCFPLVPFMLYHHGLNRMVPNMSLDIAMNRVYATVAAFASMPPLAVTKNERELSTIQLQSS